MKHHWSTVVGLPVFSSEDENMLGKLRAVFVNPETGQLLAFLVGWSHVVSPRDIREWKQNGAFVHSTEDLAHPEDILRLQEFGLTRTLLNGKKVFTKDGKKIGTLKDFIFDTATDALVSIVVAKQFLFWEWDERTFPVKEITEITEAAIILNLENEQKEKERSQMAAPTGA